MRPPIRALSLILLLAPAASASAGTVFRCSMPDGSVRYAAKALPGVECAAVSGYESEEGSAPHPRWDFLLGSPQADTYLQLASMKRQGDSVSLWVLDSYKQAQTAQVAKGPYLSAIRRLTIQCSTHEVTYHKITYTAQPFGLGDYVGEWRPLGVYRDFATPGSVDDSIATYVCKAS